MIIVALNNEEILSKLKKHYSSEVYPNDITFMEGVLKFLTINKGKYDKFILITKDNLEGNLSKELYIKQLKLACEDLKIILLTPLLTENYKEFLFSNKVFNIIEGKCINIEEICECIKNNKNVVYKLVSNKNTNQEKESTIISKQTISFYGTSGSGKSYISRLVSKKLFEKLNINIALLDLDIQNPSLDIYNNISNNNNSLEQFVDAIDKNKDLNNLIRENMCKNRTKFKINYMTNNSTIYESQNKFNYSYCSEILENYQNNYDYVLIDLPATPFFDIVKGILFKSTYIFFVVNPNFISLRQAVKYLDLITKFWKVPKNNISIIVNKITKNSLDNAQINSILKDYKIILNVDYNNEVEGLINGLSNKILENIEISKIYEILGIENLKENSIKKIVNIFKNNKGKVINDS